MNNFLSFLGKAAVENVNIATKSTGVPKKQRNPNPTFLGFRIWSDGSVYPSQALVQRFNLEYPAATCNVVKDKDGKDKNSFVVVGDQGNGFDIINTALWGQLTGVAKHFIAVAIAPKDSPKLDLFSATRYSSEAETLGKPLASVMDQGTATFGKETLLPMIEAAYGVKPNEEGFIDMQVITVEDGGINLRAENGVQLLPKVISRGEHKGKPDYTRRENVDIFMLYPSVLNVAVEDTLLPDANAAEAPVATTSAGEALSA